MWPNNSSHAATTQQNEHSRTTDMRCTRLGHGGVVQVDAILSLEDGERGIGARGLQGLGISVQPVGGVEFRVVDACGGYAARQVLIRSVIMKGFGVRVAGNDVNMRIWALHLLPHPVVAYGHKRSSA